MTQAYFLTGTDTGIGKTFSACALLHAWRTEGLRAIGYKPVAAGAELIDGQWRNEDALCLHRASSPGVTLEQINPVCLREPCAPHIAARLEGKRLTLPPLLEGFADLAGRADRLLVEGVGGFRVPLGEDFDSADLAVALDLPVILVVGLRLGCLNHALLSAEAILARGLTLSGWIGNSLTPEMPHRAGNLEALQASLPAPCLGVLPHAANNDPASVKSFLTLL